MKLFPQKITVYIFKFEFNFLCFFFLYFESLNKTSLLGFQKYPATLNEQNNYGYVLHVICRVKDTHIYIWDIIFIICLLGTQIIFVSLNIQ